MKRNVGLSLSFRDMWQSSCCGLPPFEKMKAVAEALAAVGCFDRVETDGGAFEQLCLIHGINPNRAVRELTEVFSRRGIRTQMLERGLNALALRPVPEDVRRLMFKVKKAQGVDVVRSFCGLNDPRNLRLSVECAKSEGMVSQVALPIVNSPVHTIGHYMSVVEQVVDFGCDEICLKDMSGQGSPSFLSQLECTPCFF